MRVFCPTNLERIVYITLRFGVLLSVICLFAVFYDNYFIVLLCIPFAYLFSRIRQKDIYMILIEEDIIVLEKRGTSYLGLFKESKAITVDIKESFQFSLERAPSMPYVTRILTVLKSGKKVWEFEHEFMYSLDNVFEAIQNKLVERLTDSCAKDVMEFHQMKWFGEVGVTVGFLILKKSEQQIPFVDISKIELDRSGLTDLLKIYLNDRKKSFIQIELKVIFNYKLLLAVVETISSGISIVDLRETK